MKISDGVGSALKVAGKRQKDLAELYGKTKQSMSTKITRDQWFGKDLVKVAKFCGADLAFVFPNGTIIKIESDETDGKEVKADESV